MARLSCCERRMRRYCSRGSNNAGLAKRFKAACAIGAKKAIAQSEKPVGTAQTALKIGFEPQQVAARGKLVVVATQKGKKPVQHRRADLHGVGSWAGVDLQPPGGLVLDGDCVRPVVAVKDCSVGPEPVGEEEQIAVAVSLEVQVAVEEVGIDAQRV